MLWRRSFINIRGGLHIEMAGLKVIGDWLGGGPHAGHSGFYSSAGIKRIMRTRRARHVTSYSLHIHVLLKKSYAQYIELSDPGVNRSHLRTGVLNGTSIHHSSSSSTLFFSLSTKADIPVVLKCSHWILFWKHY